MPLEKILLAPAAHPGLPPTTETQQKLNIDVVYTSVEATLAALKEAAKLADNLGARIELVVPQVVPYPLPIESPPVSIEFNEKRFRVTAAQSPVETTVRIYLWRDRAETLAKVLRPGSLVVLGGRRRWWPTRETMLARRLRKAGHEVVFTELK